MKTSLLQKIIHRTDDVMSVIVLATIFVLVFFAVFELYSLLRDFSNLTIERVLHTIAFIVVFVKAYRLLLYYMKYHHVRVRYVVEISIIAPAVELIFAPENRSFELNILFAVFSISMLVVYMLFYERLRISENETMSGKEGHLNIS